MKSVRFERLSGVAFLPHNLPGTSSNSITRYLMLHELGTKIKLYFIFICSLHWIF